MKSNEAKNTKTVVDEKGTNKSSYLRKLIQKKTLIGLFSAILVSATVAGAAVALTPNTTQIIADKTNYSFQWTAPTKADKTIPISDQKFNKAYVLKHWLHVDQKFINKYGRPDVQIVKDAPHGEVTVNVLFKKQVYINGKLTNKLTKTYRSFVIPKVFDFSWNTLSAADLSKYADDSTFNSNYIKTNWYTITSSEPLSVTRPIATITTEPNRNQATLKVDITFNKPITIDDGHNTSHTTKTITKVFENFKKAPIFNFAWKTPSPADLLKLANDASFDQNYVVNNWIGLTKAASTTAPLAKIKAYHFNPNQYAGEINLVITFDQPVTITTGSTSHTTTTVNHTFKGFNTNATYNFAWNKPSATDLKRLVADSLITNDYVLNHWTTFSVNEQASDKTTVGLITDGTNGTIKITINFAKPVTIIDNGNITHTTSSVSETLTGFWRDPKIVQNSQTTKTISPSTITSWNDVMVYLDVINVKAIDTTNIVINHDNTQGTVSLSNITYKTNDTANYDQTLNDLTLHGFKSTNVKPVMNKQDLKIITENDFSDLFVTNDVATTLVHLKPYITFSGGPTSLITSLSYDPNNHTINGLYTSDSIGTIAPFILKLTANDFDTTSNQPTIIRNTTKATVMASAITSWSDLKDYITVTNAWTLDTKDIVIKTNDAAGQVTLANITYKITKNSQYDQTLSDITLSNFGTNETATVVENTATTANKAILPSTLSADGFDVIKHYLTITNPDVLVYDHLDIEADDNAGTLTIDGLQSYNSNLKIKKNFINPIVIHGFNTKIPVVTIIQNSTSTADFNLMASNLTADSLNDLKGYLTITGSWANVDASNMLLEANDITGVLTIANLASYDSADHSSSSQIGNITISGFGTQINPISLTENTSTTASKQMTAGTLTSYSFSQLQAYLTISGGTYVDIDASHMNLLADDAAQTLTISLIKYYDSSLHHDGVLIAPIIIHGFLK